MKARINLAATAGGKPLAGRGRRRRFACRWLLIGLLVLAGCAGAPPPERVRIQRLPAPPGPPPTKPYEVNGKLYYPLSTAHGFVQTGLASWYGRDFHGRRTSSGERYNMYARTAAHKTLPFGTFVEVTNLKNGRKTVVRINDRGPFVKDRIIDLTLNAAQDLAMVEDGVVPVRLVALGQARERRSGESTVMELVERDYRHGVFTVQVGAFTRKANAERLYSSLRRWYPHTVISAFDRGDRLFYRVWVGKFSLLPEAERAASRLRQQGFVDAFVMARD